MGKMQFIINKVSPIAHILRVVQLSENVLFARNLLQALKLQVLDRALTNDETHTLLHIGLPDFLYLLSHVFFMLFHTTLIQIGYSSTLECLTMPRPQQVCVSL